MKVCEEKSAMTNLILPASAQCIDPLTSRLNARADWLDLPKLSDHTLGVPQNTVIDRLRQNAAKN